MSKLQILFRRIAWVTVVLTLILIMLGAYVRLTDAGLGCPDWPGCYGKLTWPTTEESIERANVAFPERPVETGKAWREMAHRYLAGVVGLLIFAMAWIGWRLRGVPGHPWKMAIAAAVLVVFQGLLGMWTVTLLLKPAIVTAHLLGGLATLALVLWLAVRVSEQFTVKLGARLRRLWWIALLVLCGQIFLGGWVSTNYAAVACGTDFPTCQQQLWPEDMDFAEGFRIWRGLGVDYEFGVLESPARTAIHMAHRAGAIVATGVLVWFIVALWRSGAQQRPYGVALAAALLAQLLLGVINILAALPLWAAVAHNGGAAVLIAIMVTLRAAERRS